MTDITPGFTFSGGQLVSANNLNKVVGDAIINDESIDAIKLSEDSVSGAIMGNPTLARADVSDQDYFLIYDTSESKIKKLAKVDVIGTLNIQFEGGVVSGVAGQQTTIDGSTGALVMQTGNLTMVSGNLETNDAHVKGDLQVDGQILGNIAYEGQISFGDATTGSSSFDPNDGSLSMDSGIEADHIKLTGFDPNSPTDSSGGYSNKWGVQVTEDVKIDGQTKMSYFLNDNFIQVGGNTFLAGNGEGGIHALTWGYNDTNNGGLTLTSMPSISNRAKNGNYQGIQNYLLFSDQTKDIVYDFRGDIVWIYPESKDVDADARFQISSKDSSNNLHTWFFVAHPPNQGNVKVLEIVPSSHAGSEEIQINGGTNLSVSGSISAGAKPFKIEHPLLEGKHLMHCAIEAPRGDLIYRGKHTLGADPVNLDTSANMTEGTFVKLVKDVQVFVQNNAGWDRVKGRVEGNKLYIDCENAECTDVIDWLVIGERKDDYYISSNLTDVDGNFITECDCIECSDCPEELVESIPETPTNPVQAREGHLQTP